MFDASLTGRLAKAIDAVIELENWLAMQPDQWTKQLPRFIAAVEALRDLPKLQELDWAPYVSAHLELLRLNPTAKTVAQFKTVAGSSVLPTCWHQAAFMAMTFERSSFEYLRRSSKSLGLSSTRKEATTQAVKAAFGKFTKEALHFWFWKHFAFDTRTKEDGPPAPSLSEIKTWMIHEAGLMSPIVDKVNHATDPVDLSGIPDRETQRQQSPDESYGRLLPGTQEKLKRALLHSRIKQDDTGLITKRAIFLDLIDSPQLHCNIMERLGGRDSGENSKLWNDAKKAYKRILSALNCDLRTEVIEGVRMVFITENNRRNNPSKRTRKTPAKNP